VLKREKETQMTKTEMLGEIVVASRIIRIALAYCNAQTAISGLENAPVPDRQWQACCAVAARFIADPRGMTAELCHHEWRLSQMRSSHPSYWPTAASRRWDDLLPLDQYVERAGLAAMRAELGEMEREQVDSRTHENQTVGMCEGTAQSTNRLES
jgi:hypothetical protein